MDWKKLSASPWTAAVLITALGILMYAQMLSFDYVWDDHLLFLDKTALLNDPLSWKLLADPVLPGTTYMRPLVFLTFFTEFHLFGQTAALSHLVNLIFFICNVLLIFAICRHIAVVTGRGNGVVPGFLAAVLYIVHPAVIESTAWVSGRFDLMATFFLLLGVQAYLKLRNKPVLMIAAVATAMLLALLSKELGVVMPALVICVWGACYWDRSSSLLGNARKAVVENYALVLTLGVLFAGYLLLRKLSMGNIYHSAFNARHIYEFIVVGHYPIAALRLYLEHTFVPFFNIGPYQPIEFEAIHAPLAVAANLFALALTVTLVVLALRKGGSALWLFLAWLVCLLPVLHIIPLSIGGNLGHDRFLATALAFAVMGVALGVYDLQKWLKESGSNLYRISGGVAACWIVLAMLTTLSILPFWSSDLRLWALAYRQHPDFAPARYNYLYGAMLLNRVDIVKEETAKQIKDQGGLGVGEQILYANILLRQGNPESMQYMEGVLYALPKFHEQPDGRAKAKSFLLSEMQMAGAYLDYSIGLMGFRGDPEQALKYNEIAQWYLAPSERIVPQYQRAAIYYALGDFDRAEALVTELEGMRFHKKDEAKKGMSQALSLYCRHYEFKDKRGVCERLGKEGFFDTLRRQ